ncbi:MAG: NAD(P)H-dependent oxidoreductase [Terrimicrobiaceae bacterium]|nr:NAD(P)H-dependent oxidoreductase [Terrimicrobiaceae bacterium]
MSEITADQLLEAQRRRYATKQFDPAKKIPAHLWQALEFSLVLSPSSFGLQPWKFVVVENPAVREQLVAVSWNQRQVADASHFVVFAVKHPVTPGDVAAQVARTMEVTGASRESLAPLETMMTGFLANFQDPEALKAWASRQVYLALGNFMTSAALLGVDTCPMEGIDPAAYDRILGLEGTGFFTLAGCAAGYRHPEDKYAARPKVRFPADQVIQRIP